MFRDLTTARVLSNTKSESNTAEIKAPGTRGFLRTSGMPEAEGFTGQQQCRKKGESIYLPCALNKLVMLGTPEPFPNSEQTSQALFPDREYFQPSSCSSKESEAKKIMLPLFSMISPLFPVCLFPHGYLCLLGKGSNKMRQFFCLIHDHIANL